MPIGDTGNDKQQLARVVRRLKNGQSVALVALELRLQLDMAANNDRRLS